MKQILIVVLFWGVVCVQLPAQAFQPNADHELTTSGNDFLATCDKDGPVTIEKFECSMYVSGVTDGAELIYQTMVKSPSTKMLFCFPPHSTNGQELQVVIHFIKSHPERAHLETRTLIFAATMDSFGCKNK